MTFQRSNSHVMLGAGFKLHIHDHSSEQKHWSVGLVITDQSRGEETLLHYLAATALCGVTQHVVIVLYCC